MKARFKPASKWQDNNGQDRYTTEVVVSGFGGQLQLLDKLNNQPAQQNQHPQNPAPNTANGNQPQPRQNQYNNSNNNGGQPQPTGGYDDFDDSIPF